MTINFNFEKETKNTVRFTEDSDAPIVGTLYVQKLALKQMGYEQGKPLQVAISTEVSK